MRGFEAKDQQEMTIQKVMDERIETALKRIQFVMEETNNQILDTMKRKRTSESVERTCVSMQTMYLKLQA